MSEEIQVIATAVDTNKRVDSFLAAALPDFSRSKIKNLILAGNIFILRNGLKTPLSDISQKVLADDVYNIIDIKEPTNLIPKEMAIEILYEDDYLLVINKQAGLVVHPGAGNFEDTLVNGLLYKYQDKLSSMNGEIRPGIVHRLDKDTSGVLVVAKDDNTHAILAKQFEEHSINRSYRALVWGRFAASKGSIESHINRSPHNRLKMAISSKGKFAKTDYEVLDYTAGLTLVELTLHTGRTHQIRVHLSSLGHSVVADPLYGSGYMKYFNKLESEIQELIKGLQRQALHAYKLGFIHPQGGEYLLIEKEEPKELLELYRKLGFKI
ncbi:MAG: RluA family pseudouridine synthase [Alphaproteobacteria bacterium]|jgi:23S rRNA pseudouridine1911/1915/1917 synthase|nr:RluA family pseudouridine synthase [Alphaproteobacteria bacterium]